MFYWFFSFFYLFYLGYFTVNEELLIIFCSFLWFDLASSFFKRSLDSELYYKVTVISKKFSSLLLLKRDLIILVGRSHVRRWRFKKLLRKFFRLGAFKFVHLFSIFNTTSILLLDEHSFPSSLIRLGVDFNHSVELEEINVSSFELEEEVDLKTSLSNLTWYSVLCE